MNAYYAPRSDRFFERTSVRIALAISAAGSIAVAANSQRSEAAITPVDPTCQFSSETKDFTFADDKNTLNHAVFEITGVDANTCMQEAAAVVQEQLDANIPHYQETIRIPVSVTKR